MRKMISILLLMICSIGCFSQSNGNTYTDCIKVDIGPYNTLDKVKRVFAITSKDSSNIYLIGVTPTNSEIRTLGLKCDGPVFYLQYRDSLYSTLKRIEEKDKEWTTVAENTLTGQLEKEIPIELPIAGISIWNIDKPQFELMPVNKNKFVFTKFSQSNTPCLQIHMVSHFNYFNQNFRRKTKASTDEVSFFSNTEQFANFVELIAPDKIRKNMGSNTIDALFK